jgi:hypothetical protein
MYGGAPCPKAEHAAVEGPHGGALLPWPHMRGEARLCVLSHAPAMSGATVFFPRGGGAAGGEESLGMPPIFRVRVCIEVLFRF